MSYDPFYIILTEKFEQEPEGANVYYDAIKSLNRDFQPGKIVALLKADSKSVVMDGLLILSEMGERGCNLTDLALEHIGHEDWTARFYLADSLLACSSTLRADQIGLALNLCDDENVWVRCKIMELLSWLDTKVIEEAVHKFAKSPKKLHFESGLSTLSGGYDALDQAKHLVNSIYFIERCFAGGLILKLARQNPCKISINTGTDEEEYLSKKLVQICEQGLR